MTDCPPNESLADLLADTLSVVERGPLAKHVDGCRTCQQRLARLTGTADTEVWRRAERPAPGSLAEEDLVRRLKEMRPSSADLSERAAWPDVPGYELLGELGRGGMGVVYQARQVALDRIVALKMVLSGVHAGPKELARFRAEAAVLARLQHPNIVQIYDVGETAGRPYFVLEFVAGGSLAQQLDGMPQPARLAAELVETLARAVQAAHAAGVVHRDLKPANVLLQIADCKLQIDNQSAICNLQSAIPKITDFGLAKVAAGSGSDYRGPTVTGELLGTPHYMAPEQAATPRQTVGPAADVYALGAILYELLTGRPPFIGENPLETILQVLHTDPVSVARLQPSVPPDLETICLKCLQKEPRRRYATAQELADDLHRFLNGEEIRARPPSALYHWAKFARQNKALVAAVLGLLAVLIGGVIATSLFALRATQQRDAALRQTYYARLAAAGAALRDDDVAAAALQLHLAPENLRDWEWHHFSSRLDESLTTIRAPDGGEMRLVATTDGFRFVAVGRDDVRLLDADGGTVQTVPRNGLHVLHVEFTARGLWVCGHDDSGHLVVLDESDKEVLRLDSPSGQEPNIVAVSPDRTRLAVNWNEDGPFHSLVVYDLPSGQQQAHCKGHPHVLYALSFSPDGKQIASASEDKQVGLWDSATGELIHWLRGHEDKIRAVAFAPNGARVVTGSGDGTVRQWDTATGQPLALPPYRGHRHEVFAVAYSPDGRWIASGDRDGVVRLWSAADQQDIAVLHGHTGAVVQLAFRADGRQLASAAKDGAARIWEVGTGPKPTLLRGHQGYVYAVAYSPDGEWLASGSWDRSVRLWDARTGEPCATFHHPTRVRVLAFSPDGSWLVAGCDDQTSLEIWDVASGQLRQQVPSPGKVVQAITVSPDGKRIAAAESAGRVGIVDVASGQQVGSFRMAGGWVETKALAYSPDGRWIAGTGEDSQEIDIHDAHTYERTARLVGHTAAVYSVAFSPDGRQLVSAGGDHSVRLWDLASGEQVADLKGHTEEVFAAVFHPDGRRIASAGRDQAILLWDVATHAEVARLQGHRNYVFSLAFRPDGSTLASGSGDYTVRLWDTQPLAARLKARREAEAVRPDAERLVTRMLLEGKEPSELMRTVRADRALSDALRHEAQRALWRLLAPPE